MSESLRIEQFKALKEEYRQYLLHVQQLWKFKLATLGAVISAAVLNEKIVSGLENVSLSEPISNARIIAAIGFALLPLVSLAIDLKTYEIGLHVRLISDFIQKHYKEVEIQSWEKNVWTGTTESGTRTFITLFESLGTTAVVLVASCVMSLKLLPAYSALLILWNTVLVGLLLWGVAMARRFLTKAGNNKYEKKEKG